MYSYGLESAIPVEVCKWVTGNKWHADTFSPHVARIDREMTVNSWYEELLGVQGRGMVTCMLLRVRPSLYSSGGSLYVSIQIPPYTAHYPGYGELWYEGVDLVPGNTVTIAYRGYCAFPERFSVQAAGSAGSVRFTGTVWYVTY